MGVPWAVGSKRWITAPAAPDLSSPLHERETPALARGATPTGYGSSVAKLCPFRPLPMIGVMCKKRGAEDSQSLGAAMKRRLGKGQVRTRHLVISLPALARSLSGRVLIVALGAIVASAAHAETRVTSRADTIRLEARDAPVSEVLTALGATYELRSGLGQPLTGTYAGSVREVISHVLAGYDYVVESSNGRFAVIVYGISKSTPNAPTAAAAAQDIAQNNVAETRPAPAASAIDNTTASSQAVPVVATPPPAPPPNQAPVVAMLGATALSQIPGSAAAAAPASVDMAALTLRAGSSLQNLVGALSNVPHN